MCDSTLTEGTDDRERRPDRCAAGRPAATPGEDARAGPGGARARAGGPAGRRGRRRARRPGHGASRRAGRGPAAIDRRRAPGRRRSGRRRRGGGVRSRPGDRHAGGRPRRSPGRPVGGDPVAGALLGDLLSAAAPRLPVRDAARLREAHPGASDREIADALVARAARLTSTIGAATGGITAAHWFAPPSLLALPLELGAETVLVAGVEVVLIGELHELYGRPAPGDARARAAAYLAVWSGQRPVDGVGTAGLGTLLSAAGMRALQRRVTRRLAGAVPTAAPFLIGAAIAGRGNRRATEKLAEQVQAELRATRPLT
ncbi:hypothetical protein [Blastococcus brunescens]|uniref:EcsC family protein n=1 Tax=Blastococcus brunescens TaxID=1564165 RepID=A0ABZ1ATU9_9ACTN|nr:hypothetical protein [Blastococcus sp. BMG 8361]WRL62010.1 hypothetical protein U6N30_18215 [Blastococcus sp. BMG 8361]